MNPRPTIDRSGLIVVTLDRLAHGRTGDKGNRSNLSVIAWRAEFWPLLVDQVTEDAVGRCYADRQPSKVTRYLLPRLHAMNFVLDDALDGGVNRALNLDAHGKCMSYRVLAMPISVPAEWQRLLRGV